MTAIATGKGIEISIKIDFDAVDATTKEIRYTKPDNTTGKWSNPLVTYVLENTQHYLRYITQSTSDINAPGVWYFQAHVIGQGYDLFGDKVRYTFDPKMTGTF